jgi:predicted CoA-binding protein
MTEKIVAVLGASKKPERYSNTAVRRLKESGYAVIPVNPKYDEVEGIKALPDLALIKEHVHTLTIYLSPEKSRGLIEDIVRLNPERVILNPGAESGEIKNLLKEKGLSFLEACTLVLLATGQF